MKASIKFREEQLPLMRAKVPINVLGLPFVSGVSGSAGDDARSDLRLDLATAFKSGPSVRLSYRPLDASRPLSVALKYGVGRFGSPLRAPFAISAELDLLGAGGSPSFNLRFKPRLGDFAVAKTTRSTLSEVMAKAEEFQQAGEGLEMAPAHHSSSSSIQSAINGLISSFQVTMRSLLPLPASASALNFQFQCGLKAPASGGFQLPTVMMNKISVEHVKRRSVEEKKKAFLSHVAASHAMKSLQQPHTSLLSKVVEEAPPFTSPNRNRGQGDDHVDGSRSRWSPRRFIVKARKS